MKEEPKRIDLGSLFMRGVKQTYSDHKATPKKAKVGGITGTSIPTNRPDLRKIEPHDLRIFENMEIREHIASNKKKTECCVDAEADQIDQDNHGNMWNFKEHVKYKNSKVATETTTDMRDPSNRPPTSGRLSSPKASRRAKHNFVFRKVCSPSKEFIYSIGSKTGTYNVISLCNPRPLKYLLS